MKKLAFAIPFVCTLVVRVKILFVALWMSNVTAPDVAPSIVAVIVPLTDFKSDDSL